MKRSPMPRERGVADRRVPGERQPIRVPRDALYFCAGAQAIPERLLSNVAGQVP